MTELTTQIRSFQSMALIQELLNEIRDLRASRDSLQEEIRTLHEQIAQVGQHLEPSACSG